MKSSATCYRCGALATTREHVPAKSFFPRGSGLQLKTVPSCDAHNNAKAGDDQYLLAHISMHAASGDNLAKKIFLRSIAPQLSFSPPFRASISEGSVSMPEGEVAYRVDLARFDSFFDHLCFGLYFDRYGIRFDDSTHDIHHSYLSLGTGDIDELARRRFLRDMLGHFYEDFGERLSRFELGTPGDIVYGNTIIDPSRHAGSITIAHTFYGVFEVVSLLTRVVSAA